MAQIVVDATVGMALVIPLPFSAEALMAVAQWRSQSLELCAPSLWWYEVVTTVRKGIVAGAIPAQAAQRVLDDVRRLGVVVVEPTIEGHRRALEWASRLGHRNAYDAQYLALAESLSAEFWTADRALARNARRQGAYWAHWLSEPDERGQ